MTAKISRGLDNLFSSQLKEHGPLGVHGVHAPEDKWQGATQEAIVGVSCHALEMQLKPRHVVRTRFSAFHFKNATRAARQVWLDSIHFRDRVFSQTMYQKPPMITGGWGSWEAHLSWGSHLVALRQSLLSGCETVENNQHQGCRNQKGRNKLH